jgi:hypothetical protein
MDAMTLCNPVIVLHLSTIEQYTANGYGSMIYKSMQLNGTCPSCEGARQLAGCPYLPGTHSAAGA